jgi:hypothetical protein
MARRPFDSARGFFLAAFGLWMLVGGALTAVLSAWGPGGGVAPLGPLLPLPVFAALLGALLLAEAFANRKRPGGPGPAAAPPPVDPPAPPGSGGRRGRIPVWLHPLLLVPVMAVGLFGGGVVGFYTYGMVLVASMRAARSGGAEQLATAVGYCFPLAVAIPCFFVGAVVGCGQARRLFFEYVPARCPRCGGAAYGRPCKPITYHCRACGHAHATIWYEKGGSPPDRPDRPPATALERRPGAAPRRGRRRRD